MSPNATLPHRPVCPARTVGAERADVAGGTAEDRLDDRPGARGQSRPAWSVPPSSRTPTTSWPGTKGKLTMSSK